jgi:fused signal recognition particle receptor
MFGFLKDKLKSWLGKSKEEIEKKAPKKEKAEKVVAKAEKQEKKAKIEEKPVKPTKQEKIKKTKEQLKEERDTTEKVVGDINQEKLEIKTPEEKFEKVIREEAAKEDEELEEKKKQLEELQKEVEEKEQKPEKRGFFAKLRSFLAYSITEENFNDIFSELEMLLLESNVALEVVEKLREDLAKELIGKEIKKDKLQEEIQGALKKAIENILINPEDLVKQIKEYKKQNPKNPFVILFFGINGAGKTTSIAKLTNLLQKNKFSCVLGASDTFRAAAIEQLQIHADKLGVKLIKGDYGHDPSSVAFDAIKYAKEHDADVVLIDTAGRMHTKENLLHEMEKICRVTKPNLKVFVAEAVAGNDATEQAKAFNDMIGIDSSILSKTDVDEKGGTIISISYITKKPILYLGVGQKYDDLELFDKDKFIKRLGL